MTQSRLRIGTRGSPLALAQAHMTEAALAAHGVEATIEVDPYLRRPHPRPPALGGRRQGPVHQGDRGGAAWPNDRPCGALRQGHAHPAAGWADARRVPAARGRSRRLYQPKAPSLRALPHGAVVGTASLRRQAMVKRLRPDITTVIAARQCARRDCVSSKPARSMQRCWRSPASNGSALPAGDRAARRERVSPGGRAGRDHPRGA